MKIINSSKTLYIKKSTKVKIKDIEKVNVSPVDQDHPEEYEETISPLMRMEPQPFENKKEVKPKLLPEGE